MDTRTHLVSLAPSRQPTHTGNDPAMEQESSTGSLRRLGLLALLQSP